MANDVLPAVPSPDHDYAPPPSSESTSFWFDDGSVIVAVAKERFKLHRSLLTRHSSLFESLPASQDVGAKAQDPPTVAIPHGLADPKDFTALLEHLYHDVPIDSAPLPAVSSLLRVTSDKSLKFPSIHAIARERFRSLLEPKPGVANFTTPEDPEEALGLAVEHDIPSVQKPLYYSVATTSHFEPGSTHHSLPAAVTERCAALQEQLIAHFTPILFTVATAGHMTCTDVFAETWMPDVIAPALADNGLCRPIETLRKIQEIRWEDKGVCAECCAAKREEWDEEIRAVWEKVDEWLGI